MLKALAFQAVCLVLELATLRAKFVGVGQHTDNEMSACRKTAWEGHPTGSGRDDPDAVGFALALEANLLQNVVEQFLQ